MDRRNFLKATGSAGIAAAACPAHSALSAPAIVTTRFHHLTVSVASGLEIPARVFAQRTRALSAGRLRFTLQEAGTSLQPSEKADFHIGSLHDAVDLHPAFAFFAGVPGALGMPQAQHFEWRKTDGLALWHELLATVAMTYLPLRQTAWPCALLSPHPILNLTDIAGRRIACRGLARDVARGIGAIPVTTTALPSAALADGADRKHEAEYIASAPGILRGGSAPVLGVRSATWQRLDTDVQAVMRASADKIIDTVQPPQCAQPLRALPVQITSVIDRISEAVVAGSAAETRLSQRINLAYFRAWRSARQV